MRTANALDKLFLLKNIKGDDKWRFQLKLQKSGFKKRKSNEKNTSRKLE